jgi:hypothetical protein
MFELTEDTSMETVRLIVESPIAKLDVSICAREYKHIYDLPLSRTAINAAHRIVVRHEDGTEHVFKDRNREVR